MEKFDKLIDRLTAKISMSQSQVPGFILGLSGTDSAATLILLREAILKHGKYLPITAVHYVDNVDHLSRTSLDLTKWVRSLPSVNLGMSNPPFRIELVIATPPGGNHEQYRWGDLHYRAVSGDKHLWVVNTTNATEKALGTYSIMSMSVSMAPIGSLYKSEVLRVCQEYGVPESLIEASKLPDCLCGRDEFAGSHIDLIDDMLRYRSSDRAHTHEEIQLAFDYITSKKRDNDFKTRTPYGV
jgi:NH3-dependent NAD+ synthetase